MLEAGISARLRREAPEDPCVASRLAPLPLLWADRPGRSLLREALRNGTVAGCTGLQEFGLCWAPSTLPLSQSRAKPTTDEPAGRPPSSQQRKPFTTFYPSCPLSPSHPPTPIPHPDSPPFHPIPPTLSSSYPPIPHSSHPPIPPPPYPHSNPVSHLVKSGLFFNPNLAAGFQGKNTPSKPGPETKFSTIIPLLNF